MHGRVCRSAVSLLSSVAVAACGTTVPLAGRQAEPGQGSGQGLTAPSSSVASGGAAAVGGTGAAAVLPQSGSAQGPAGTSSTDAGASSAGGSAPGTRGGTASIPAHAPVIVGFVYSDFSQLQRSAGIDPGPSPKSAFTALITSMNRHGGIGGHRLKPVYFTVNGSSSNYASEAQAACAAMTQDNHVNIVVTKDYGDDNFNACLNKAGVSQVDANIFSSSAADLAKGHPGLLAPVSLALDRYPIALVDRMAATRYLSGKNYVGVIVEGCRPHVEVYDKLLKPRILGLGAKVDEVSLSCLSGAGDIGPALQAIQSAMLRFHSEGVDRVMSLSAAESTIIGQAALAASSQKYYPGYMVTTNAQPYNLSISGQAQDQLPGLHGIGWDPLVDLGPKGVAKAGSRQAEGQKRCDAADPTRNHAGGNFYNQEVFFEVCDSVEVMAQMLLRSGFDYGIGALNSAFAGIAPGLRSASVVGGQFSTSTSRRDGVGTIYSYSYSRACSCVQADPGTVRL